MENEIEDAVINYKRGHISLEDVMSLISKTAVGFSVWMNDIDGSHGYALGRTPTDEELYTFYATNKFPEYKAALSKAAVSYEDVINRYFKEGVSKRFEDWLFENYTLSLKDTKNPPGIIHELLSEKYRFDPNDFKNPPGITGDKTTV